MRAALRRMVPHFSCGSRAHDTVHVITIILEVPTCMSNMIIPRLTSRAAPGKFVMTWEGPRVRPSGAAIGPPSGPAGAEWRLPRSRSKEYAAPSITRSPVTTTPVSSGSTRMPSFNQPSPSRPRGCRPVSWDAPPSSQPVAIAPVASRQVTAHQLHQPVRVAAVAGSGNAGCRPRSLATTPEPEVP